MRSVLGCGVRAWWPVAVGLCLGLAACGNNENNTGKNNTTASDMGSDMQVVADMGADQGGADMGADQGGADMGADMGARPEGVLIAGLSAPVQVRFDARGVLHVDCKTDADCYAAQGYYHARDRFAQMDLRRRFARGRVSTLVGDLAINTDIAMRRLLTTREGVPLEEAAWEGADASTKAAFEAYTRGVNAWLDDMRNTRNGAKLSEEYDSPLLKADSIPDWEPLDSVASVLVLLEDLSNQSGTELAWANLTTQLNAQAAADLLSGQSAVDSNTVGASGEVYGQGASSRLRRTNALSAMKGVQGRLNARRDLLAKAAADSAALRTSRGKSTFEFHDKGSNNWVLGASKTQDGRAILAGDPHLALSNPALWYLVELNNKANGGDLHAAGVSFAGLPGMLIGHNEHVAWTGTVVFYDLSDVYVEEFTDDTRKKVKFNGGEVDVIEKEFTFEVAGGEPVKRTFRYVPHHGPVIQEDGAAGLSLRWVGHDVRTDLNFFIQMSKAKNIDEAKTALTQCTATNQNWVVIDNDNHIGWFPFSKVPVRPWASRDLPPWLPLPGDGTAEWDGFMDYADLPQLRDPQAGFIATANQDMSGALLDGDPTNDGYNTLQTAPAIGFRHKRIVDEINASDAHTTATVSALQGDTYMAAAEQMLPVWLGDMTGEETLTPTQQRILNALTSWQYTCPTGMQGIDPMTATAVSDEAVASEARGCLAFHYLMYSMASFAFYDDAPGVNLGNSSIIRALTLLTAHPDRLLGAESYWDDTSTADVTEGRKDIFLRALESAGEKASEKFGASSAAWRWGQAHHLVLRADLLDQVTQDYNAGPFVAPGGAFTVNVANPRNGAAGDWTFSHGPSTRFIATTSDKGLVTSFQLPGGQPHHRQDSLYNDWVQDWIDNKPTPMPFLTEDVKAAATTTIEVKPLP